MSRPTTHAQTTIREAALAAPRFGVRVNFCDGPRAVGCDRLRRRP